MNSVRLQSCDGPWWKGFAELVNFYSEMERRLSDDWWVVQVV